MTHPDPAPSFQAEPPRLRREAAKFAIAVAVWLGSSFLALNLPDVPDDSWIVVILIAPFLASMVSFACVILCFLDLGAALRADKSKWRFLGWVFGLPQILFGLLCSAMGLTIIAWVLYNSFVERLPEYSGGFMTIGIGLPLLGFGVAWMASAFQKKASFPEEETDENTDKESS